MSERYAAEDLTTLRRLIILITLTSCVALYAMTVTIANVALPDIQGSLSATQDQIALIVTFNIVATAVATPMTGWLTGQLGQRRVMIWCVSGFTVASLLCGLATSLPELVVYRVLQGLTGAPLVPLSQAISLASYPQRQHGTVTAIFGVGVVLGPIAAPVVGGYLSEEYGWRSVFYMLVPFGLAALLGVLAFVRDVARPPKVRLDWTGFLALSIAIASFQLLVDRGERNDWFDSVETVLEAALALLALWVFVVHTATGRAPFLSVALFRDRNFVLGMVIVFIFGMTNFTPMVLIPPLLQNLRGYPDDLVGLLLALRGAGTLFAFVLMIWGSRLDPRIWLVTGFALQGIAGWWMAQFSIDLTTMDVALASTLQGFGVGLLWVPITLVTFSTLDPRLLPEGSSVFHLLRNLGSSLHISLSVALVIRAGKINYAQLVEQITPFRESLLYAQITGGWNLDSLRGLKGLSGELARQATMIGYIDSFYFFAFTAWGVIPLIFLVRYRRAGR